MPQLYCEALPSQMSGRHAVVLDPMVATGRTLTKACGLLSRHGVAHITVLCLIAVREGLALLDEHCPDAAVVTAAIDPRLDAQGFIVPGLGDAGDRLYGVP